MAQEEQIKAMLDKLNTMLEFDEGIAVDSVEELKTKYNEFVEKFTVNNEQPLMLQPQCVECKWYDGFGQCLEHGNRLFENCEDFEKEVEL